MGRPSWPTASRCTCPRYGHPLERSTGGWGGGVGRPHHPGGAQKKNNPPVSSSQPPFFCRTYPFQRVVRTKNGGVGLFAMRRRVQTGFMAAMAALTRTGPGFETPRACPGPSAANGRGRGVAGRGTSATSPSGPGLRRSRKPAWLPSLPLPIWPRPRNVPHVWSPCPVYTATESAAVVVVVELDGFLAGAPRQHDPDERSPAITIENTTLTMPGNTSSTYGHRRTTRIE